MDARFTLVLNVCTKIKLLNISQGSKYLLRKLNSYKQFSTGEYFSWYWLHQTVPTQSLNDSTRLSAVKEKNIYLFFKRETEKKHPIPEFPFQNSLFQGLYFSNGAEFSVAACSCFYFCTFGTCGFH